MTWEAELLKLTDCSFRFLLSWGTVGFYVLQFPALHRHTIVASESSFSSFNKGTQLFKLSTSAVSQISDEQSRCQYHDMTMMVALDF